MTDELALASRQKELDFLADEAGFAEPPKVDIIRWVSLNEWPQAQTECLREAGWPVELENGGVVMKPLPESQAQAYRQASYVCTAKYPVDARQSAKLSPAQNETLYDYYVEWAVPCLQGQGYQTPEPATREVWAAAEFPSSVWDPWSLVPPDDWYTSRVTCPLYPDLQYLWS